VTHLVRSPAVADSTMTIGVRAVTLGLFRDITVVSIWNLNFVG
jgi:hypothetical protein